MQDFIKKSLESSESIGEIIKLVYQDVAQPGMRKLGTAIEDVVEFLVIPTLFLRYGSERATQLYKKKIALVAEKIEPIPENEIVSPPTEIAVEVLDHLTRVQDENLIDLFTSLLANSCRESSRRNVHPRFVHVLKQISSDEAKIINELARNNRFWFVAIYAEYSLGEQRSSIRNQSTIVLDPDQSLLSLPDQIEAYISNLESLGVTKFNDTGILPGRPVVGSRLQQLVKANPQLLIDDYGANLNFHAMEVANSGSHKKVIQIGEKSLNFKFWGMEESLVPTDFGATLLKALQSPLKE